MEELINKYQSDEIKQSDEAEERFSQGLNSASNSVEICAGNYSAYLDQLADLFEYPDEDYFNKIDAFSKQLGMLDKGSRKKIDEFLSRIKGFSIDEIQEVYTATYDLSPVCSLNIGIHLFGEEDYKRGNFMAALKSAYERNNFSCGNELPDFLPYMVKYLLVADETERRELIGYCLLNALEKMISLLDEKNPYHWLLSGVYLILKGICPEKYELTLNSKNGDYSYGCREFCNRVLNWNEPDNRY
jgi:nitrate reductase delta subunit